MVADRARLVPQHFAFGRGSDGTHGNGEAAVGVEAHDVEMPGETPPHDGVAMIRLPEPSSPP